MRNSKMVFSRLVPVAGLALVGVLLGGRAEAAGTIYKSGFGERCDLLSANVVDTSSCIDVSRLDGTVLKVPSATTRISTRGLVLCGKKEQSTDPMDIVYVLDQSGSMTPTSILPLGSDTLAFSACSAPSTYGPNPSVAYYHGVPVIVISSSDETYARQYCLSAGDPTSIRASLIQNAIQQQAKLSPGSRAAWISFSGSYSATDMVDLSDTAARGALIRTIENKSMGSTFYHDPLGWSRVLLDGGTSYAGVTTAGSPNKRKAIVMISDGEPDATDNYLNALNPRDSLRDPLRQSWRTSAMASPPIYGFLLSETYRPGQALQVLAQRTGGVFTQIPPSNPDSLRRSISQIMGAILGSGRPDSLRIINTSNAQVSNGITSGREAGGFRVRLDSIVGLQPGKNELQLRFVLTGVKDSIVTAIWTVIVGDSASQFSPTGTDSLLTATCTDASRLSLRPGADTSRLFADGRDTSLVFHLDVSNAGQVRLPTNFVSALSKDSGSATKILAQSPATPWIVSDGLLSWRLGSAIRTDAMVQTGTGWDTVRMVYLTPRDPRDSAVAALPVLHPRPARIWFSLDTASGATGTLQVNLLDSMQAPDTASVTITHRLADTLRLVMTRTSGALFQASFAFAQGAVLIRGDGVLQTGPLRQIKIDSVFAVRGTLRDTAILRAPVPRLRFVDSLGLPGDSLGATLLDPGGLVRVRLGLFLGDSLLTLSDSVAVALPSWLEALSSGGRALSGGVRLVGGRAELQVRGAATGAGGMLLLRDLDRPDTLLGGPISVNAYRLVFVGPSGATSTSWPIDRMMGSTESVKIRIVGKDGLCYGCSGELRLVPGAGLYAGAPTGGVVRVVGGEARLVIGATRPVDGGLVTVAFDSLSLSLSVQPIRFRAPAPDSAVYEDRDGDGGVDHVRVYFQVPWNAGNGLVFPWPGAGRNLDLSKATFHASADSLILDLALGASQALGATGWSNGSENASWSWSVGDPAQTFPAVERIAPVPLRARIVRGSSWDTLVVISSEPLVAGSILPGSDLVRKLAPSLPALPSANVSWSPSDRSLRFAYPSNTIDGIVIPGDSVRFSPGGDVRDSQGSVPGTVARAVVVEGIDHGPLSVLVTDSDADGRADRITLRFATVPRWTDRYVFGWPDGNGGIDKRTIDASSAVSDSGGRIQSFSVDLFAYGATSCPAGGCVGFGSMENSRYGDTIRASFDEQDGVVPVIAKATLSFGRMEGDADTVRLTFSEPVDHVADASWVRWGRPSLDSLGDTIVSLSDPVWNDRVVQYLVDTSFHGVWGDSVRIGAWPDGGVSDFVGNRPGRFAHWSPIEMGETPSRLVAMSWPAMVKYEGWIIPVSDPGLTVLLRPTSRDVWKTLDGKAPMQDPSHYVGIRILSNKDLDAASLYVYDHMGLFVGHIHLAPLLEQMRGRSSGKTLRGDYEILVAWNGKDTDGRVVPSGPYLARLMAWQGFGHNRKLVHWIFKIGWRVPTGLGK